MMARIKVLTACCILYGLVCSSNASLFEWHINQNERRSSCGEGEFDCGNGRCIPDSKRCDGKGFDCWGNADEQNCESCKGSGTFYCPSNAKCIAGKFRCNAQSQCYNGEDEQNCDSCQGLNAFYCPSDRRCFDTRYTRCNGYKDCSGGEDEMNCDSCNRDAFFCSSSRQCISQYYRCNYFDDCPNGEDEDNCDCTGGFRCDAGVKPDFYNSTNTRYCLQDRYMCDKTSQCIDGQDENGCNEMQLRLVGGSSPNEGRLEVSIKGVWGTVCDDYFYGNSALVACRQLGISSQYETVYYPPNGEGKIWLDNVACNGDEESLLDCPRNPIGQHNCDHYDDVGLRCGSCQGENDFYCATERHCLDIRDTRCNGYRNCLSGEDEMNCDSCNGNAIFCSSSRQCIPKELQCNFVDDCPSGEDEDNCDCTGGFRCDAGVKPGFYNSTNTRYCLRDWYLCDKTSQCIDGQDENGCNEMPLRLVNGSSPNEGRLEVLVKGVWGTVCYDSFYENSARVACRQLGFSSQYEIVYAPPAGEGKIWLDNVACSGDEESLLDCPRNLIGQHNCGHWEDVGIRCGGSCQGENDFYCATERRCLDIRDTRCNGYKNCLSGEDEMNCDSCIGDAFFCSSSRQCTSPSNRCNFVDDCLNGEDEDNCDCTGGFRCDAGVKPGFYNSTNTRYCLRDWYLCDKTSQCVDGQDENDCPEMQLRLVGGSSSNEGRLEVFIRGVWGTVCDDNFNETSAQVACRQLGYLAQLDSVRVYDPLHGEGRIWLDNVACSGDEESLLDCPRNFIGQSDCSHYEDVGIRCGALDLQTT